MPKQKQALPGRRTQGGQPDVKIMVEHYRAMINERADMTEGEKKRAVEKYERGLKEAQAEG